MNRYQVLGPVGEGAHGIVLKAQNENGEAVALKKVAIKKITDDGIPVAVIREIKALQCIEHEHVVHLIDVFPQGLSFVMVFEFMPSNLWEILNTYKLTGSQVKCYALMLLKGVRYLHQNRIMHRDLKPANLLISQNKVLKIGDFGLCRLFFDHEVGKVPYSHQVATRWYRSPELLYGARFYTEGVDLWATGCIVAEMLIGRPIFPVRRAPSPGENDIDQLYKVIRSLGTPDESMWPGRTELPDYNKISFVPMEPIPLETLVPSSMPGATDFVGKFLLYDSSKRLSAKAASENEFFKITPLACSVQSLPPLPPPKPMNVQGPHGNFEGPPKLADDLFTNSRRRTYTVSGVSSH